MSQVLGICVTLHGLRAVLVRGDRVLWAATAQWDAVAELAAAIGRLAGELPQAANRVRVVLARELVQLRTVMPAPPLSDADARRYVAFETPRLFRRNGEPLVTDARVLRVTARERALWAAAASEPLVDSVLHGCQQAGLRLESLGPATEVFPWVVEKAPVGGELGVPNGDTCERIAIARCGAWRSRFLRGHSVPEPKWTPPLAATGERAPVLAAAYGATLYRPTLDLLPPETKAARLRASWKQVQRTAAFGAALWVGAGVVQVAKLEMRGRAAARELRLLGPAVDSAVVLRRELNAARTALKTMNEAQRHRSRTLVLLADLTNRLGDAAFLAAFQLSPDSTLRLVGYAPQGARVLAQVERAPWVRDVRFEAPVTREGVVGGELDRFSLLLRLGTVP